MDQAAVELVREYFRRMNTNDFQAVSELLSDDYILEWPQSKERVRGRDHFIAINTEYPANGPWRFTLNKVVGNASEVVSDVSVTDGVQQARAITFTTVRAGKIVKQVEFWPENYAAPENRRHLVELME